VSHGRALTGVTMGKAESTMSCNEENALSSTRPRSPQRSPQPRQAISVAQRTACMQAPQLSCIPAQTGSCDGVLAGHELRIASHKSHIAYRMGGTVPAHAVRGTPIDCPKRTTLLRATPSPP
jgi:hypothetical protein